MQSDPDCARATGGPGRDGAGRRGGAPAGARGRGRGRGPLRSRVPRALFDRRQRLSDRAGGVVIPRTREDIRRTVAICHQFRCPLTMRGGGTSQAGQAIGPGIQSTPRSIFNRVLEVNAEERWARVEPGIVLDELNAQLRPHGLRFAPDISTASRATIGGMIANNSSGARSVYYGKTIDHVLELDVVLSDGRSRTSGRCRGAELDSACRGDSLEARLLPRGRARLAAEHADEDRPPLSEDPAARRRLQPRRVRRSRRSRSTSTKLLVGSEGTLGVVLEAKSGWCRCRRPRRCWRSSSPTCSKRSRRRRPSSRTSRRRSR